jgi:Family of unknown function (DUF6056)
MGSPFARLLRTLFVIYVVATLAHLAWVVAHEPFSFDAWNFAVTTKAQPITVGRFFRFWGSEYLGANPRFGQPFAYLSYKVIGFAEVGTPLVYAALVLGCFVLGTGRWPSWRRGRDLAVLAMGVGLLWFAAPSFPMVLFCRAYSTNYAWACAIQLWFLVPARLWLAGSVDVDVAASAPGDAAASTAVVEPRSASWAQSLAYGGLGIAAGMCNEHTGPTLVALSMGLAAWRWRARGPSRLLNAGAVGALIGFALIFFAPGQAQRYEGLAEQASLGERFLQRGFTRNLDILQGYLDGAAPILALLVVVLLVGLLTARELGGPGWGPRRAALRVFAIAVAAGVAITVTLFVSPKLGPRFYLHACVALLAALVGVVDAFLEGAWGRRVLAGLVTLAVIASGYAAYSTLPLFDQLQRESRARLAQLQAQPRGAVVTVESFSQVPMSWWFLGDDFRDRKKRDLVATYFDLGRVILRGSDGEATLGVTDVQVRFRAQLEPELCLDQLDGLELPALSGRDVAAMQHAFSDVVTRLRARPAARLRRLDLEVVFSGERPAGLPPHVYVASWRDGELLAFAATVLRVGASRAREVTLPAELRRADWDIEAYAVGVQAQRLGGSRDGTALRYTPGRFRQYWILACRAQECFVLSARR